MAHHVINQSRVSPADGSDRARPSTCQDRQDLHHRGAAVSIFPVQGDSPGAAQHQDRQRLLEAAQPGAGPEGPAEGASQLPTTQPPPPPECVPLLRVHLCLLNLSLLNQIVGGLRDAGAQNPHGEQRRVHLLLSFKVLSLV